MNDSQYRIVGTAGHIDHGKSALVRALTGVDPDRLREEKERGITIDLGFADTTVGDLHLGFIDVPGHERFVKNMLAGVGGIDAVLLVVAADESVMPQTREHFAICQLLGIRAGVVAITKCDLVDDELVDLVELETRELLAGTALEAAAMVRTSVVSGAGLEQLRLELAACLARTDSRPAKGIARLPIDRIFTMRGFGTIVTGTLFSGTLAHGDRVAVLPGGLEANVRGLQVHGQEAAAAHAGQRVALNLQGVQVGDLERGQILCHPGSVRATHLIDARLDVLPTAGKIEHLQRIRFHHGAAEVLGRVAVLEGDAIPGGSDAVVQLRLETPYPAVPGDRFIIRRYSPVTTLGGGEVLASARAKHRRGVQTSRRLRALVGASIVDQVVQHTVGAGLEGLGTEDLRVWLGQTAAATEQAMQEASRRNEVTLLPGPRVVSSTGFKGLRERIVDTLQDYHRRYPLRPAMPKEDLRNAVGVTAASVFQAATGFMVRAEAIRPDADGFALATHLPRLPAALASLRDAISRRYRDAGLAPASPSAILEELQVDQDQAREVLHFLLREGELVRVREDLVVHVEAIDRLRNGLQGRFPRGSQFSVADFKDWAGVSRKHAIPLLEYLDASRITRRVGDLRERV